MPTPRKSPRSLTKAQQIAEEARNRAPAWTPECTPRPPDEYAENPLTAELETPGRNPPAGNAVPDSLHSPREEVHDITFREELFAAAASHEEPARSRDDQQLAAGSAEGEFPEFADVRSPRESNEPQGALSQKQPRGRLDGSVPSDRDEFDIPAEATPMTEARGRKSHENRLQSCPEDKPVVGLTSNASTSLRSKEMEEMRAAEAAAAGSPLDLVLGSPEFEKWMQGLTMGQKMRVQERLAIRAAITKAEDGIRAISNGGEHDADVWEAASYWQLLFIREDENLHFLGHFGYKLADATHWQEAPFVSGPELDLQLDSHVQRAGHTWYNVKCKLSRAGPQGEQCIEWIAPRRLVQLRMDLHHRVKEWLGLKYDDQFKDARFAKLGGPPGTTARLRAWLAMLATSINQGIAQPNVAMLALVFFAVPLPENVELPHSAVGHMLRQTGDSHSNLESHSNLGGDSELGSHIVSLTS